MKNTIGIVLIWLGGLAALISIFKVKNAPNLGYFIGTLLPGMILAFVGVLLCLTSSSQDTDPSDTEPDADDDESTSHASKFKLWANIGVGVGVALMFLGNDFAQRETNTLLPGLAISFVGWGAYIFGCVNYMRWKGGSGWLGLFGYLLLPGLLILAFLPNRRNQAMVKRRRKELKAISAEDERSGLPYLLALIPLGVIYAGVLVIALTIRSEVRSDEWKPVDSAGTGFQAFMPGTSKLEKKITETPAGNVELYKFTVEPKGKKEAFLVVTTRLPKSVVGQLGGREKLLELGRKDLVDAAKGTVQRESPVVLDGVQGLELEIQPPKGGIIKGRVFVTESQIFQVFVHVPLVRLGSADVQKFFDSFRLLPEPGAPVNPNGR
jgi:hypothetical protein